MARALSDEDTSEDDEETCAGPCTRALLGSGRWWSRWVFRDEQRTVKRQTGHRWNAGPGRGPVQVRIRFGDTV